MNIDDCIAYYLSNLDSYADGYKGTNKFWDDIIKKSGLYSIPSFTNKNSVLFLEELIGVYRQELDGKAPNINNYILKKSIKGRFEKSCEVAYRALSEEYSFEKSEYNKKDIYAIAYLIESDTLESYAKFTKSIGIKSNLNTIRYFVYINLIERLINLNKQFKKPTFFEIGSAGAGFCVFAVNKLNVGKYYIVDIPHMLSLSLTTLKRFLPNEDYCVLDSDEKKGKGRIILVPAQHIGLIDDNSADISINTYSFQEMDKSIRDKYFEETYRILKVGSIFLNINYLCSMDNIDGTKYDNNPTEYKYRDDSRCFFSLLEPINEYMRDRFDFRRDFSATIVHGEFTSGLF